MHTKADKRVEGRSRSPRRVIVNVATRPGDVHGQERLAASLSTYGGGIASVLWANTLPPKSPNHADMPYAFKVYAIEHVARRGFTSILWVDASVWFIKSPVPIFEWMEKFGAYTCGIEGGYVLGTWCSDAALDMLNVSRDDAFRIPLVFGGCYGVSTEHESGRELLSRMSMHARDGSFRGSWTNANQEVSTDVRVLGHRHDMSALSVIANRIGLHSDVMPSMFTIDGYGQSLERTVALCRGIA